MNQTREQQHRLSSYFNRLLKKPAVPDSWKKLADGKRQIASLLRDGYLIVRENRWTGQMFLGCTNYRRDGKGCNRSI